MDAQVVPAGHRHGDGTAGQLRTGGGPHGLDAGIDHVESVHSVTDVGHRQGGEALDQLDLGQLSQLAHRLSTTFGTRRMKASAWRISLFPVTLRAWLPRCSARSA
ncbi:hypothetical protein ACFFX0_22000 [Citricoccus parietis]|uniref:Uncharacterized protein n=1 Tax=Citricoccus parietis TaxID=592307 RepID=A0ABV5G468_9MICC